MSGRVADPPPAARRRCLRLLGTAVACAAATPLASLAGCGGAGDRRAEGLRVELGRVAPGGRLRVMVRGNPVELRRDAGGEVTAMSLLCTHTGCEVRWQTDEGRYVCPCHDGRFDAGGKVISGPPPAPLRRLPVRRQGDAVWVGEPADG